MIRPATVHWIGLLLSSNQLLPDGCTCSHCEAGAVCRREHPDFRGGHLYCGYSGSQFVDFRRTHTARLAEQREAVV